MTRTLQLGCVAAAALSSMLLADGAAAAPQTCADKGSLDQLIDLGRIEICKGPGGDGAVGIDNEEPNPTRNSQSTNYNGYGNLGGGQFDFVAETARLVGTDAAVITGTRTNYSRPVGHPDREQEISYLFLLPVRGSFLIQGRDCGFVIEDAQDNLTDGYTPIGPANGSCGPFEINLPAGEGFNDRYLINDQNSSRDGFQVDVNVTLFDRNGSSGTQPYANGSAPNFLDNKVGVQVATTGAEERFSRPTVVGRSCCNHNQRGGFGVDLARAGFVSGGTLYLLGRTAGVNPNNTPFAEKEALLVIDWNGRHGNTNDITALEDRASPDVN